MTAFSPSYRIARERFLAAAKGAGADLESHVNPAAKGAEEEDLAVDIAWLGPKAAPRMFLCTSGMHGLEGPAGSAVQLAWLQSGAARLLPEGVGVVLVHALNAWGFSHASRHTENNVDLNRNFLDHAKGHPPNPFYHHIAPLIRPERLDEATLKDLMRAFGGLRREIGVGPAYIAADAGQYTDPEGFGFGGTQPEFGHRVLQSHVVPRLRPAREVGLIDWHTGVGAFGEVAFLLIGGLDSSAGARAMKWWGEARVRGWAKSDVEGEIADDLAARGLERRPHGQLYRELEGMLAGPRVTGAVIEFGSERPGDEAKLIYAYLYERWLRFVHKGPRHAGEHAHALAMARALFVPEEAEWRAMVEREGPPIMDQAIAGLATQ